MAELRLLCCSQRVLLQDAEYEQAAKLAMALLRHLHAWGPVAKPPAPGTPTGRLLQLPDPPQHGAGRAGAAVEPH